MKRIEKFRNFECENDLLNFLSEICNEEYCDKIKKFMNFKNGKNSKEIYDYFYKNKDKLEDYNLYGISRNIDYNIFVIFKKIDISNLLRKNFDHEFYDFCPQLHIIDNQKYYLINNRNIFNS